MTNHCFEISQNLADCRDSVKLAELDDGTILCDWRRNNFVCR